MRGPPLMRRYAGSCAMSNMRTALEGTASVIRERGADLAGPQSLVQACGRAPNALPAYPLLYARNPPSLRNCISRIIGVSPPISSQPPSPKWRKQRQEPKPPSSGRVEFLRVLEEVCLPLGSIR